MAGDDMSSWVRSDGAVVLQVAATHARGFHGDDHLARPRRGIRKVLEREFSIPEKDDAAHGFTFVSDSPTSEPYHCVGPTNTLLRWRYGYTRATGRPQAHNPWHVGRLKMAMGDGNPL